MINNNKQLLPIELGDELFKYPSAGIMIYNRKILIHPKKKSDYYILVLQFILARIICLSIEPSKIFKAMWALGIQGHVLTYLDDSSWYCIL